MDKFEIYKTINDEDGDGVFETAYNFALGVEHPSDEKGKATASNVQVFCDLWVNNKKVATTRVVSMEWP